MKLQAIRTAKTLPFLGMAALALVLLLGGCQTNRSSTPSSASTPAAPPAAKLTWSGRYAQHIQPIFDKNCVSCHGEDRAENGLRLNSYEGVMKGTRYGPVVIPGSSSGSTLLAVVRGAADPSIRMPHDTRRLGEQELENLTLWVEAGAPAD